MWYHVHVPILSLCTRALILFHTHTCMHVHIRTHSWSSTYDDNKQRQYHSSLASVVHHQPQQAPPTQEGTWVNMKESERLKELYGTHTTHMHTSICLLSSLLLSSFLPTFNSLPEIYRHHQITEVLLKLMIKPLAPVCGWLCRLNRFALLSLSFPLSFQVLSLFPWPLPSSLPPSLLYPLSLSVCVCVCVFNQFLA